MPRVLSILLRLGKVDHLSFLEAVVVDEVDHEFFGRGAHVDANALELALLDVDGGFKVLPNVALQVEILAIVDDEVTVLEGLERLFRAVFEVVNLVGVGVDERRAVFLDVEGEGFFGPVVVVARVTDSRADALFELVDVVHVHGGTSRKMTCVERDRVEK